MKYERLTEYGSNGKAFYADLKHDTIRVGTAIERLAKLENKIEKGELISTVQNAQSEQEIEFFAEHNAAVRKQAVREFAERVKMAFYYEFDELIPSIMADRIDALVEEEKK